MIVSHSIPSTCHHVHKNHRSTVDAPFGPAYHSCFVVHVTVDVILQSRERLCTRDPHTPFPRLHSVIDVCEVLLLYRLPLYCCSTYMLRGFPGLPQNNYRALRVALLQQINFAGGIIIDSRRGTLRIVSVSRFSKIESLFLFVVLNVAKP